MPLPPLDGYVGEGWPSLSRAVTTATGFPHYMCILTAQAGMRRRAMSSLRLSDVEVRSEKYAAASNRLRRGV
jgi:hypothetical protein